MSDQYKDNVKNIAASPEKQTPPLQPPAPEEPMLPDPKPDAQPEMPAAQPEIPPPAPMPPVVPGIPMPGPPPEVGVQNVETVIQSACNGGWAQATGIIWERPARNIDTEYEPPVRRHFGRRTNFDDFSIYEKDIREDTLVGGF